MFCIKIVDHFRGDDTDVALFGYRTEHTQGKNKFSPYNINDFRLFVKVGDVFYIYMID